MTETEFDGVVNDLIKFGKDLGLNVETQKFYKNFWCNFWHPEVNLNLLRFIANEVDGKIFDLKIIIHPLKKPRNILLNESKLKTFDFKKYMKAYLVSYKYLKMKLEKQQLDEEFEND